MAPTHLGHFKTPERAVPTEPLFLEPMLVYYLVETKMINVYMVNYIVLTYALKERPLPSNL